MTETDKVQDFVSRMKSELNDLRTKCNKLEQFLDSEAIKALDATEQTLLNAQHAAMTTYEHILDLRLSKHT